MSRKIAIIGRAPRSRYLAPFHDDGWEIWTCSPGPADANGNRTDLPRWDRFYELHAAEYVESQVPGAMDWLKEQAANKAVIFQDDFPLDELVKSFGIDYFTNTISYMIAHAIHELVEGGIDADNPPTIGLWGCDFAHNTEYANQRPNAEFWLGVVRGCGIKLEIPAECDLCKHAHRYGFDNVSAFERNLEARIKELSDRRDMVVQQMEQAKAQASALTGGATELAGVLEQTAGVINGEERIKLEERLAAIKSTMDAQHQQFDQIRSEHDMLTGCIQEAKYQRRLRGTAVLGGETYADSDD